MESPMHPGVWVKQGLVAPRGLTVTQAAELDAPATARPYVPRFLSLTADELEGWADALDASSRLAVLTRRLVHSTAEGLTRAEFHGNGDAQRPGWDGLTEAERGTPWVPRGRSGWELGVNGDPKTKADDDYDERVAALDKAERAEITLVFVTPRRRKSKERWIKGRKRARQWRDVRVYDASDLEQWLEQSIAGQVWLANELDRPSEGVRTLERCWEGWRNATEPPLPSALLRPHVEAHREALQLALELEPPRPLSVAADSVGEALAFLAHAFGPEGGEALARHRARVLVFDAPGALPKLARGREPLIAVASSPEVEAELLACPPTVTGVFIRPRDLPEAAPTVTLEPTAPLRLREGLATVEGLSPSRAAALVWSAVC